MVINSDNCLVVSDIKKSIDLMDEFVDGDYEFMELKNWFGVIDSHDRGFSVYDNTGRMQVSLIVAKDRLNNEVPLCEHDPTMTELRQMKHHHIYLDRNYPQDSISYSIKIACQKWEKDVFTQLPMEICLRAQTSYNRMDYGCEWLGGGDWEEKTMYGETTDFFIVGIILHEPYKHVQQEALEILAALKYRCETLKGNMNLLLSGLKNTNDIVLHKGLGATRKECRVIEFTEKCVIVQFAERTAKFQFPESYLNGFLINLSYEKEVAEAKQMYNEIQVLEQQIAHLSRVIDDDDFGEIYDLVWKYRESRIQI